MPFHEERRVGERQIGAGEPGAGAAEHHRIVADAQHGIAERMRRDVVVAGGAQDQPGAGAIQEVPDADDQQRSEK
jgi:hypothetical protein